jgi:hypothetical protein
VTAASEREEIEQKARHMSDDEWQAFTTHEAAKAMGKCLGSKGNLDRAIKTLAMRDLKQLADKAIFRWIYLNSIRLSARPESKPDLGWLILA